MPQHWPEIEPYKHQKVLVTGGLGFLGVNLVSRLHQSRASIRVLDITSPRPEGVLKPLLETVHFYQGDLRDELIVAEAVRDCDVIFNLAGKSGAVASNTSPLEDLDINVRGQLMFLEVCRRVNPQVRIIFPSSRLVYKPTSVLPVSESTQLGPLSIYGVHKLIGESYHRLFHDLYGMPTTVLRITNPYGPFQRREQAHYGIINMFIRLALEGQPLSVYGDGLQLRDYVHVDDVVRAFLVCGAHDQAGGRTFNVGSGKPVPFKEMANLVVNLAQSGAVQFKAWPDDMAQVETGDFVADISLITEVTGWRPRISFETGLAEVIRQYRETD